MPRRSRGYGRGSESASAAERRTARGNGIKGAGVSRKPWLFVMVTATALLLTLLLIKWSTGESPVWLRSQAEAAVHAGDWTTALRNWRAINATKAATSLTHLGEARACLALGRAGQAEDSLNLAINTDPADPEPWRLMLQILRVEDRAIDALRIGWQAYDRVNPEARRELLRELTMALLGELPDELVRTTLQRWVDADSNDINARSALWQRITDQPRATDPDRSTVLNTLEALVTKHPDHVGARTALVTALANAGEPERGRAVLDEWPDSGRDTRYWRLRGRWDLEYDHRPDHAVSAFERSLAELPHDWRSWYRLARALRMLKRDTESRDAAKTESRIREALDPLILEPRLDAAFAHLDNSAALNDLALLCQQAGLNHLADAWRREFQLKGPTTGHTQFNPGSHSTLPAP